MKRLIVIVPTLLAGFGTSNAEIVFSNFSATPPGYVADSFSISYIVPTMAPPQDIQWAMGFSVPAGPDFVFTGFVVPMTFSGSTASVDFTLASDSSGAPGSSLETIEITLSNGTATYTGDSVLNPTLDAGSSYWLEAAVSHADPGTYAYWNLPVSSLSGVGVGPTADRDPPFLPNWFALSQTQAAFEIDGTAVPEPHYSWAVVIGCLLVGVTKLRKSRSHGVQ